MIDVRELYTGHLFRHDGAVWVMVQRGYSRKKKRRYVVEESLASKLVSLEERLISHGTLVQPVQATQFEDITGEQALNAMEGD